MIFTSSGTAAKATTDENPITLITLAKDELTTLVVIINEGSVAGDFSLDAGTTWARLPADCTLTLPYATNQNILVRRADGSVSASDLADLYGFAI